MRMRMRMRIYWNANENPIMVPVCNSLYNTHIFIGMETRYLRQEDALTQLLPECVYTLDHPAQPCANQQLSLSIYLCIQTLFFSGGFVVVIVIIIMFLFKSKLYFYVSLSLILFRESKQNKCNLVQYCPI